jgi:hypothetical protein
VPTNGAWLKSSTFEFPRWSPCRVATTGSRTWSLRSIKSPREAPAELLLVPPILCFGWSSVSRIRLRLHCRVCRQRRGNARDRQQPLGHSTHPLVADMAVSTLGATTAAQWPEVWPHLLDSGRPPSIEPVSQSRCFLLDVWNVSGCVDLDSR